MRLPERCSWTLRWRGGSIPIRSDSSLSTPSPLGDDLLDPTLARIVQSEGNIRHGLLGSSTRWPMPKTSARSPLARLVERGILHREEDRFMWVLRTRRYPIDDYKTVQEVKLRIMGVILSDQIPDARDIVIISLADVCRIFEGLMSGRELKAAAPRIEQVRRMDPDRARGREGGDGDRDIARHGPSSRCTEARRSGGAPPDTAGPGRPRPPRCGRRLGRTATHRRYPAPLADCRTDRAAPIAGIYRSAASPAGAAAAESPCPGSIALRAIKSIYAQLFLRAEFLFA